MSTMSTMTTKRTIADLPMIRHRTWPVVSSRTPRCHMVNRRPPQVRSTQAQKSLLCKERSRQMTRTTEAGGQAAGGLAGGPTIGLHTRQLKRGDTRRAWSLWNYRAVWMRPRPTLEVLHSSPRELRRRERAGPTRAGMPGSGVRARARRRNSRSSRSSKGSGRGRRPGRGTREM